jgi:peroxiredoxin
MKRTALLVILILGVPVGAAAQKQPVTQPKLPSEARAPTNTPPTRRAPSISGQVFIEDEAPSFELDASNGQAFRLGSTRGYWTVIAFADRWQSLASLQEVHPGTRDLGVQIVGVCHEKAHTLLGVAEREKLPVLLLADVTGEVSATYGLYDFVRSETEPGVLILDPHGIVRMAIIGRLPPAQSIVSLTRYMITGT